ncbi:hypothetical protein Tco_0448225 [Tanacetum coccineum]
MFADSRMPVQKFKDWSYFRRQSKKVLHESSGTALKEQDTSSRSGNDAHADDADIRPIYDEEPMVEVQTTAKINIFTTGQQHTEQPKFNNEGKVDPECLDPPRQMTYVHNRSELRIHDHSNEPSVQSCNAEDNRSYALSWKPCQGDSLNLPDHSQSQYAIELLKKHDMDECVSMSTPMATKRLDADLQGTPTDQMTYHQMIGGLIYLTVSRPDIAFATFVCAHYQARPTVKYLKKVKQIIWYLRQSYNIGLWYLKDSGFELIAYSDADHTGCKDDCKSTSGGI